MPIAFRSTCCWRLVFMHVAEDQEKHDGNEAVKKGGQCEMM